MADNRKGKDKRYYFSRAQMIMLAGGFTVASAIIFLLGMVVGKGIEERKIIKAEEPLMKMPVKPEQQASGAPAASQPKEELTFYDTLTKPSVAAPLVEETAKAKTPDNAGKDEPRDTARKISEAPQPAPRIAAEKPRDGGERTALRKPVEREKPPEKATPVKPVEQTVEPSVPEPTDTAAKWTVQVNAFPDEKAAKTWVDRLKNKGYNAYMSEVRTNGKTWYRVRVGRYSSREQAERIEHALRTKENLTKAFAIERKADG